MFQHVRCSAVRALFGPRFQTRHSAEGLTPHASACSQRRAPTTALAAGLLLALSACGSGGGSSDGDPNPNPPANPAAPTVALALSATTVQAGASSTLTWSSTGATSCVASGDWSGAKNLSGTQNIAPSNSGRYTYRLTCSGAGGSASANTELVVTALPAPTLTMSLSPDRITVGQSAILSWSSTHAESCDATAAWGGAQVTTGSATVNPSTAGNHTYTLTCRGPGGEISQSTVLAVSEAPSPPAVPTVTLTLSPTRIVLGEAATISWSSTDADSCLTRGAWNGGKSLSGSERASPTSAGTYSYVLECSGAGGAAMATQELVVSPAPTAPSLIMSISPPAITLGEAATLYWSATDVTSCTASGAWSGTKATRGTQSISPSELGWYTYALECTGPGGITRYERQLSVDARRPTATISVSPSDITLGDSVVLTWSSTDTTSCTASNAWTGTKSTSGSTSVTPTEEGGFVYDLTCEGASGSAFAQAGLNVHPVPTEKPTVDLSLSSTRIMVGADATLTWTTANAGPCAASNGWSGNQAAAGSTLVSPIFAGTHPYTLTCSNQAGDTAVTVELVAYEPAVIKPGQPIKAHVGTAYSQQLTVANGAGTYTWTIVAGALPAGVRLTSDGKLLGTPTTAGTGGFTVQARNGSGESVRRKLSLPVVSAACPAPTPQPPEPAPVSTWQWTIASQPTVTTQALFVRVDPEDVNVQYLAAQNGLFVTVDGGLSWTTKFSRGTDSVEFEPGNSCTVFAIVRSPVGDELHKSIDRGQTWVRIKDRMATAGSLLISRTQPGLIVIGSRIGGDRSLFDGFYRTTDGGTTWSFVKVDGGSRGLIFWDIEEDADGALYSGSEIHDHPQPYAPQFFRSRNGGETWQDVTGTLWWHVASIQSDPDKPIVYAMLEGGGLYKTLNSGDTWNFVSFAANAIEFALNPSRPHELYASQSSYGINPGGVYVSTDRGMRFAPTGLSNIQLFHGLSLAQSNRLIFNIGTEGAIWRAVIPTE